LVNGLNGQASLEEKNKKQCNEFFCQLKLAYTQIDL